MSSITTGKDTDIKTMMKNSYNILAVPYAEWSSRLTDYRTEYLLKLIPHLEKKQSDGQTVQILELGCGAGKPATKLLTTALSRVHVTANDISEAQISMAKQNLSNDKVTFHVGDMMDLSFEHGTFDAIIAMYSLLHLPRDEQTLMLGRIKAWLKPGSGYLLVNFPVNEIQGQVDNNWLGIEGADVLFSSWGTEGYNSIFKNLKLDVVERNITDDAKDASFVWYLAIKLDEQL